MVTALRVNFNAPVATAGNAAFYNNLFRTTGLVASDLVVTNPVAVGNSVFVDVQDGAVDEVLSDGRAGDIGAGAAAELLRDFFAARRRAC